MTTGDKIKSLRLDAKLSRTECARQVEMPLRTLENWESGINKPKEARWLIALAKLFGVPIDELISN